MSGDKNESSGKPKKSKSLKELADEYQLNKLLRIRVKENSPIQNKSIKELAIRSKYGINIVKIEKPVNSSRFKRYTSVETIDPEMLIEKGDIINCHGSKDKVKIFVEENGLEYVNEEYDKGIFSDFQETGIAEVIIMPKSNLINGTVEESRFREEFNVNVLGIQRSGEYYMENIREKRLHSGDALLVQGQWKDIAGIGDRQNDLVLVGQPLEEASKITLDQKAPIAATIMLLMIVAMTFNLLPSVTAVLLASVLMVITGCLKNMEEAYSNINWQSVILIGAMMPMSLAFEKTGAAGLISNSLVNNLGELGPYALLAGIYFATSLLTMFISNTATAVLFTPIAFQAALDMQSNYPDATISPLPFLFAVAVGASMCFASPFSTPPNALVMSAGRYTFMDYVKVGLPLQIITGIIMVIILPFIFPFFK